MSEKPPKIQPKRLRYDPDLPNAGYSDSQLHEMIRGPQVSQEFGIPNETLQNYREKSVDENKLYGPAIALLDGDRNFYYRIDVVVFLKEHSWRKPQDTSDGSETSDNKQKLEIVRGN